MPKKTNSPPEVVMNLKLVADTSGAEAMTKLLNQTNDLYRQIAKSAKDAETSQAGLIKGLTGVVDIASGVGTLAKSIATLGGASEKSIEQMAKSFEKFKQTFDTFKEGLELFKKFNETMSMMKELAAPAQAASGAAGSIGPKAAAAAIPAGAGAATGAGVGEAVAIGALLAAAGTAVHDGLLLIARSLGILGPQYETMTGVVADMLGSIKQSAELEADMERQREAHNQLLGQLKARDEQYSKSYEAREKIAESGKAVRDAELTLGRGRAMQARAEGQLNEPATRPGSAAAKMEDAQFDREQQLAAFGQASAAGRKEFEQAQARIQATKKSMEEVGKKQAISFGPEKESPNSDENRPGSFRAGLSKASSTVWNFVTMGSSLNEPLREAEERLSQKGPDKTKYDVPTESPAMVSQAPLLRNQQTALRIADEMAKRDAERAKYLQQQAGIMHQQVQAAGDMLRTTQDQIKAEQTRITSGKSRFAELTSDQRAQVVKIAEQYEKTHELPKSSAMVLKNLGISTDLIDKTMAASVTDKETHALEALGAIEKEAKLRADEQKAIEAVNKARQQEVTLLNAMNQANKESLEWRKKGSQAQSDVQQTTSKIEGFSDPTAVQEIKNGAAKVTATGNQLGEAFREFSGAIAKRDADLANKIERAAQRLNGAHSGL
jgi:hypothetical protein